MDPLFLRLLIEELNHELQDKPSLAVVHPWGEEGFFLLFPPMAAGPAMAEHPTLEPPVYSPPADEAADRCLCVSLNRERPHLYMGSLAEHHKSARSSLVKALKRFLPKSRLVSLQPGNGPVEVVLTFERREPKNVTSGQPNPYIRLTLSLAKGHPQAALSAGEEGKILAVYPEARGQSHQGGIEPPPAKPRIFDIKSKEMLAALLAEERQPCSPGSPAGANEDPRLESRGYDILEEKHIISRLMEHTRGLSRLWARELFLRAEADGYVIGKKELTVERLYRTIRELEFTLTGPTRRRVVEKPGEDDAKELLALSALPLIQFPINWQKRFPSLSRATHYYYENIIQQEERRKIKEELLKVLHREEKRLTRLCRAILADKTAQEAAKDFKLYGELLNSQVKAEEAAVRGRQSITLTDYYQPDSPPLTVPLDPTLSVRQNAKRYFHLYQKSQRGQKIVEKRLKQTQAELTEVETKIEKVNKAQAMAALMEMRERLIKEGWLQVGARGTCPPVGQHVPQGHVQRAPTVYRGFHRFTSTQGYEILVGKNAKENDRLTFTQAQPHDLWLHAQGYGGSHVLVRPQSPKNPIPDKTLEEAAQLAVYFSQARGKGRIKVLYAQAKEVKKPKGAKAGAVTVGRYRTVIVDTDNFKRMKDEG